jgi:hypothetical protein
MRRLVCIAVALLGLAGCGVPTSGDPTTIPSSEIPYGLAEPEPSDPTDATLQADVAGTAIYLLGPDKVLVPRGRDLPPAPLIDRVEALLRELAAGPTAPELADKLSTALPPEVLLDISEVTDGTATIDIGGPVEAPSGADTRVAVAQIVLTATSIPQVHAVRLMREGELIDAPLPDGELTSAPLTADDYASYLTPPRPPTPTPSSPR